MAANRCPDCSKFVSTELGDEPEVEITNTEDMGNGKAMLSLHVHLTKVCAECGTELSEKEEDVDVEVSLSGFESVL
jgi:hypothetical protein